MYLLHIPSRLKQISIIFLFRVVIEQWNYSYYVLFLQVLRVFHFIFHAQYVVYIIIKLLHYNCFAKQETQTVDDEIDDEICDLPTSIAPVHPLHLDQGSLTRCLLLMDPTRVHLSRVSNRTWTRTVNPNEPFHFGEPEPNLNQQTFTSVNLNPQNCAQLNPNRTWTPKKSKNIFFHIRMPLALVHAQWEQWWSSTGSAISPFFFWTKRVTTVKF